MLFMLEQCLDPIAGKKKVWTLDATRTNCLQTLVGGRDQEVCVAHVEVNDSLDYLLACETSPIYIVLLRRCFFSSIMAITAFATWYLF